MAPVSGLQFRDHNELTGEGINGIISYWPASQKTHWHDTRICLGETRTDTLNRLKLLQFQGAVPGRVRGNPTAA